MTYALTQPASALEEAAEAVLLEPSLSQADAHLERYRKLMELECVGNTKEIWEDHLNSAPKALFLCKVILRTIDACLNKEYVCFDAHTTSNCCHGIALLVRDLIFSTAELDLEALRDLCSEKIQALEQGRVVELKRFTQWIPEQMLALGSLYVLAFVREIQSDGRVRSDSRKFKTISVVGTNFARDLSSDLQVHFSNLVAYSYQAYLPEICPMNNINGVPVEIWGSYVKGEHIRVDKRGIYYAPCIYSTQVCLAHLIEQRAKVVLVNDIINSAGEFVDRYVCIFQGDGAEKLKPLSQEEIDLLDYANQQEPVIVFGGYVRSDVLDLQALSDCMLFWQNEFPSLMAACEVFYPQFPEVSDDTDFNSSPIIPIESGLRHLLFDLTKIPGVSASDPHLYCSSHTYTASLVEVLSCLKGDKCSGLLGSFYNLQISSSPAWGIELQSILHSS